MTTQSIPGWQPSTPSATARPVQVESASEGLTGCELPDGRGLLAWPSGTNVRMAVVSSPADFQTNNVVTAPDVFTAFAPGGSVRRCSVYDFGGQVYATVVRDSGTTGFSEVWKAGNPSDPAAGWALHGTITSGTTNVGSSFAARFIAGIPLVLPSGRWVVLATIFQASGTSFYSRPVGAFYSDNTGASWTLARKQSYGFFSTLEISTTQIGRDPGTGALLWETGGTGANARDYLRSTDNGVTYAVSANNYGTGIFEQSGIDNGTDLFGLRKVGTVSGTQDWVEVTGTGTSEAAWVDTGEDWWPMPQANEVFDKIKAVGLGGTVYVFKGDAVAAFAGPGGWYTGFVGVG